MERPPRPRLEDSVEPSGGTAPRTAQLLPRGLSRLLTRSLVCLLPRKDTSKPSLPPGCKAQEALCCPLQGAGSGTHVSPLEKAAGPDWSCAGSGDQKLTLGRQPKDTAFDSDQVRPAQPLLTASSDFVFVPSQFASPKLLGKGELLWLLNLPSRAWIFPGT